MFDKLFVSCVRAVIILQCNSSSIRGLMKNFNFPLESTLVQQTLTIIISVLLLCEKQKLILHMLLLQISNRRGQRK